MPKICGVVPGGWFYTHTIGSEKCDLMHGSDWLMQISVLKKITQWLFQKVFWALANSEAREAYRMQMIIFHTRLVQHQRIPRELEGI